MKVARLIHNQEYAGAEDYDIGFKGQHMVVYNRTSGEPIFASKNHRASVDYVRKAIA